MFLMRDLKYMLERIPLIACPSEQLKVMPLPSFGVVPTQWKHYDDISRFPPSQKRLGKDMERRWSVKFDKAANEVAKPICISIFNRRIYP